MTHPSSHAQVRERSESPHPVGWTDHKFYHSQTASRKGNLPTYITYGYFTYFKYNTLGIKEHKSDLCRRHNP